MNENGIIHRDLKPENIILEQLETNEINIKIIDFGTSRKLYKN